MEILGFDLSAIDVAAWWRATVAYAGPRLLPSLGIAVIALVAYFPVRWIIWRLELRFARRTATKLDDRIAQLARRALQISAVAWAGWRLFELWGLPSVAAAVDAIWIAALAFPVSALVGDRIELWSSPAETGSWGDVIEIGLRATKIRNPDNLVIVVPNNEIMRRDIINYTMSGSRIRLRIPISVEYEANLAQAKDVILAIARDTAGVVRDPPPVVIVRSFGASDVQLQLRVWIEDARGRRAIADEITARVLERFAAEGMALPYPKRDIYMHQVDAGGAVAAGRGRHAARTGEPVGEPGD